MIFIRKFCALLLIGMCGCHQADKPNPVTIAPTHSETASIQLTDLAGQPILLNNYKGKTVFINFWATWCKPCLEEMPSIEKAQAMMKDDKIVFLLASGESIEEIKEFSSNHSYPFNYVHLENGEALNFQALPTTNIFNAKGNLVFSETGFRHWNETENINLIKQIINQHD